MVSATDVATEEPLFSQVRMMDYTRQDLNSFPKDAKRNEVISKLAHADVPRICGSHDAR